MKPLKGKIEIIEDKNIMTQELIERKIFDFQDVKSAVQGLLQEIKMEKERYKENLQVISGLCIAEEKIKKWFADVFENEVDGNA